MTERNASIERPADGVRGEGEATLLPMLVGGLLMIVIGAVLVMAFV